MLECPQHHQSETADYCSVCGMQMTAGAVADVAAVGDLGHCPQCNAPKESARQVFCEGCGYNFKTAQAGTAQPMTAEVRVELPKVSPSGGKRWDAVVVVDPNLYGTPNADAPTDKPEQIFTLFEKENLLGRAAPGLRQQIPIAHDAGVSRRHAVITRSEQGLSVRDLGSANGTRLNGVELVPGVETSIKAGDVLGVGAWTRITFRG